MPSPTYTWGPLGMGASPQMEREGHALPTPTLIRTTRLSLGLTQAQAGEVIGATRRTWQDWEAGRRNMPESKWELFQTKTKGK